MPLQNGMTKTESNELPNTCGLFFIFALTHDFRVSKGAKGGSHARAVLRMQSRQLVDIATDVFSSAPLFAFDDRIGLITD
jgi:hypothetical protein